MIDRFVKSFIRFNQVALSALLILTLSSIFYFWKMGFIDGSRSESLYQISFLVDQLASDKTYTQIEELVLSEQSSLASERVESIEKYLEQINSYMESEGYQQTQKDTLAVKASIVNLLSFPRSQKVINVFSDKLSKFNSYVKNENWRTLTRMSERVDGLTSSFLSSRRLEEFISRVNSDFSSMENVTENSVLPRKDKQEIKNRIKNLRVEINMLSKYSQERKFFEALMKDYKKNILNWLSKIQPEIASRKIEDQRVGKKYIFGFLILLVVNALLFFTSFIFNKFILKKESSKLEKMIKGYVSTNLMEQDLSSFDGFSDDFKQFSEQTSLYINRRMRFGAIFQDALPFGALLLDSNLKVIWSNKYFSEQWELEENELLQDYISWDYLLKFTNINSDEDPVLEGVKNQVAGIYQIQIKKSQDKPSAAYEMYVSPVKDSNKSHVMLFFYSLASFQQTIDDQSKSIISPVKKTLNLLREDRWDLSQEEALSQEYVVAGITDILDKFQQLSESIELERKELHDMLDSVEGHNLDYYHSNQSIENLSRKIANNSKAYIGSLKILRSSVIELSELSRAFTQTTYKLINNSELSLKDYADSVQVNSDVMNSIQEVHQSMPQFEDIKSDLRSCKMQASESRSSLAQSLASFIHIKNKVVDENVAKKLDQFHNKVTEEFKTLDSSSLHLEKRVTQLEMALTKSQMVLESLNKKVDSINLKNMHDQFNMHTQEFKKVMVNPACLETIEDLENEIVIQLKSIYDTTQDNFMRVSEIIETVNAASSFSEGTSLSGLTASEASATPDIQQ